MDVTCSTSEGLLRGWKLFLVFPPLCITSLLTALESSAVSTMLPSINDHSQAKDRFVWLMNGYFISFTAFQPIYTQLAEVFGHKFLMLVAVSAFALGSGICGISASWMMLLAGRIVQGVGGAGINLLSQLIVNHLVPLRARGKYMSLIYAAFMIGMGLGPFFGGILVEKATWRWVFYINMPISLIALISLYIFLPLPNLCGRQTRNAWSQIDYIGNVLITGSVTSMLVGLSLGGGSFRWASWQVILPFALGISGTLIFFTYEHHPMENVSPILPPRIFTNNRTTTIGLILSFIQFLLSYWILYFLPVYFQGVRQNTPARSGVLLLPSVLVSVSSVGQDASYNVAVQLRFGLSHCYQL